MIIIAESKQENELVEKLAKENFARAVRREDGYAVTVWSVGDVVGRKNNITEEGAERFLECYENRLKDNCISGGDVFLEEADYDGYETLPVEAAEYEVVEVCDKLMLFTNERVRSWQVPEGLYLYHLRESDNGDRFCSIENHVGVNHGGSVLSKEPLALGSSGFILFARDAEPNFIGSGDVSIDGYLNGVKAAFISVWDGGTEIISPCMVNVCTNEVFDVQKVDAANVNTLDAEFVEIDGERFAVCQKDEADLTSDFWYK